MRAVRLGVLLAAAVVAITPAAAQRSAALQASGFADWDLDGNAGWTMQGPVLVLQKAGVPEGAIRRPAGLAIFKSQPLSNFTLQVDIRSTAPTEVEQRDVLLVFDYQSPRTFHYVHISRGTDGVHNGIFVVNNADRKRIDQPHGAGRLTDQAWHHARLERNATTGTIRVFFDEAPAPILSATDRSLVGGRVGVGSFDDTAEFKNFSVTPQ